MLLFYRSKLVGFLVSFINLGKILGGGKFQARGQLKKYNHKTIAFIFKSLYLDF